MKQEEVHINAQWQTDKLKFLQTIQTLKNQNLDLLKENQRLNAGIRRLRMAYAKMESSQQQFKEVFSTLHLNKEDKGGNKHTQAQIAHQLKQVVPMIKRQSKQMNIRVIRLNLSFIKKFQKDVDNFKEKLLQTSELIKHLQTINDRLSNKNRLLETLLNQTQLDKEKYKKDLEETKLLNQELSQVNRKIKELLKKIEKQKQAWKNQAILYNQKIKEIQDNSEVRPLGQEDNDNLSFQNEE